jgi:murein L,D-transpeptidase YafK
VSRFSMIKIIFRAYILLFILILILPVKSMSAISPSRQPPLDKIPDSIVSLSAGFVLVVDKQYQKLYAFHKNGFFTKVLEVPCSTGKNVGAKQLAGDARTPNGIFFATKIMHNPGPPEVYGSLAFPLDYPTLADKKAGRNGSNIWIHGTTKPLTPFQSNGCVVLRDSDLQHLLELIYFNKTPVIIQEAINWISQSQTPSAKTELEQILYSWNKAFIEGDMKFLDSLYLPGAEIKGKKREEINSRIKSLKYLNRHFVLLPRDISILRQDNNAVIMFDQIVTVGNDNSYQGSYNKLVLERINNKWYVIDDIASLPAVEKKPATLSASVANNTKSVPVVSTAAPISQSESSANNPNESVKKLLVKWVASWKSGDMKTYRSCYAANFKSKGMNLNDWTAYKAELHRRNRNINIRIDNTHITISGNDASATFTQTYTSSGLKSKGMKKLELKKIDGEWKIYRENM